MSCLVFRDVGQGEGVWGLLIQPYRSIVRETNFSAHAKSE